MISLFNDQVSRRNSVSSKQEAGRPVWQVFLIFLKLGLTSFGGPVAHLGYFREEFVARRKWLSEQAYADLVALCQFLPGPASSQVGIALGLSRAGYAGALAAWTGFTLPSAILLMLFAMGLTAYGEWLPAGAIHGLKVVAVAVVVQAVWGMARSLCPDVQRVTMMVAAACFTLLIPAIWSQILLIVLAGLIGLWLFRGHNVAVSMETQVGIFQPGRLISMLCLCVFFALLFVLPLLATLSASVFVDLIDTFYRAGSLVFGGGHVVLPLLQAEVVPNGRVDESLFLAGYGAAQAVPGPLFTFSAFLGASMGQGAAAIHLSLLCLVAIFIPSFLLVIGVMPYWEQLRQHRRVQHALMGVNAAVVGLLLAACYQPVWTSAILRPQDFCLGLLALLALMFWKLPPWLVVCLGAGAGALAGLV
jgi:chromate transporter